MWTYALELARTLCEQDVEIALATMGAALTAAQWNEAARIPNLGIFESTYQMESMPNPWDDVREAGGWLIKLERKIRPDIIHLNNYAHAALPWMAPKLVVAHACALSWWRAVNGEEAPESWHTYRQVVTEGLRSADIVIAPSRARLAELQRYYGLPSRCETIANGREIAFRRVPKEQFIFSSGRLWDEAKNISTLAAVAPDLAWPVCVAGETREPGGKTVSFENVRLLGRLAPAQMAERFERAPIYCLPARYESFGVAALEAALAGCALVLGDIPSLREIWGDAAIFVPPNDANGLATALNTLVADPEQLQKMAHRAHERALEFTALRMASSYLAVYSELLSPVKAQPAALISSVS